MQELAVGSAEEMRALGRRLGQQLRPGDLVVLNGPLGAGKTTLVQGIGDGLDVRGPITSPTFVIARVHPSLRRTPGPRPALVHADAYRLGGAAEVDDLDLDADTDSAVTVVEWGGGLVEGLADDRLEITISLPAGGGAADAAQAVPSTGGAEGDAAEAAGGGSAEPRIVRLQGIGSRWISAARTG